MLNPRAARFQRLARIIEEALQLPAGAKHEEYLRSSCRDNPDIADELRKWVPHGLADQGSRVPTLDAAQPLAKLKRFARRVTSSSCFLESHADMAMSLLQLGRTAEAQAELTRLQELMQNARRANDPESQRFLREAEALISGTSDTESTTQPSQE